MHSKLLLISLLLASVACGQSNQADIEEYEKLTGEVALGIQQHRDDSVTVSTPDECNAEHERYDSYMRPRLTRQRELSRSVDNDCAMMGGSGMMGGSSRMGMCDSMMGELDRHSNAACAATTSENRAEAERHCDMMQDYTSRERDSINQCGR